MKILILVFLVIVATFGTNKSYAQCSCANAGESAFDELKSSDAVFVGKVIEIKKLEDVESAEYKNYDPTFNVTFKIETAWKTDLPEVIVIKNINSSDYSDFVKDKVYLVYAKKYGDKLSAYVGCCTKTNLFSNSAKDLEEFKVKGEKPKRIIKTNSKLTESRTNQWT